MSVPYTNATPRQFCVERMGSGGFDFDCDFDFDFDFCNGVDKDAMDVVIYTAIISPNLRKIVRWFFAVDISLFTILISHAPLH